jgi:hypothetical protein
MTSTVRSPHRGEAARALLLVALAAVASVVVWRLRPADPTAAVVPLRSVVLGCAWVGWLAAGYLVLAVGVTSASHLAAGFAARTGSLRWLLPETLRHFLDVAITVGLAAALLGGTGTPAGWASPGRPHTASGRPPGPWAPASALDWPMPAAPHPTRSRALDWPAAGTPIRAASGGNVAPDPVVAEARVVVVQPGDSLWKIAARALGPDVDPAAVTIAWHQWYAANRAVIGDDPDLIRPGQRLRAPGSLHRAARHHRLIR